MRFHYYVDDSNVRPFLYCSIASLFVSLVSFWIGNSVSTGTVANLAQGFAIGGSMAVIVFLLVWLVPYLKVGSLNVIAFYYRKRPLDSWPAFLLRDLNETFREKRERFA